MNALAFPQIGKSLEPAVRVLIIDDNPRDAELSLMQLRRAKLSVEGVVALDRQQLRDALRTFVPDVVLCDFSFPDFDGYAALRIVREVLPNVPLIFVTGTITENRAIAAVQTGAADFVLKSNLTRLPSVVQRAVREAREKKRLESTLENSEGRARRQAARLESLWRIASNPKLQGSSLIPAILCEAAETIRPNQCFRGVLSRIDAATVVVIGLGVASGDHDARITLPQMGSRAPVQKTLVPIVGRSQAWDDLDSMPSVPAGVERLGWRCAISTRFEAAGVRYLLTFASPEPTTITFGAEDIGFLEVLGASFAHFLQLNHVTDQLRDAEEHSRQHAERLESLWRLVNEASQSEAQLWAEMLAQAGEAMQPGHPFRGTLWRIAGADMIVEASSEEAPRRSSTASESSVGRSMPMATSIVGKFLADGGGTQSWENLPDAQYAESPSGESHECSVVVTTFRAGSATWALKFSSNTPAQRPFGVEEHAYIEVLASYFASHIQDRWHSEQLQYHQSHDALTSLLSRSQFRSLAQSAARTNGRFAVILIDVDGFSELNESYGHAFGDVVLVEIGKSLLERVSEGEILARIAGDVFAIFIPGPPSVEFMQSRAGAFASIFEHGISTPGGIGPEMVSRTAAIGIAMAPKDGSSIDTVLLHADAALLNAKQRGHGSTVFFEEEMGGDAARRTTLRNELAAAIVDDQFVLYYQPHVEITTGTVTGCEALIRWNHPVRGLLLPGHFIPFAEQSGIITSIDAWVLRNACAVSAELAALRPGFRTYFNLSGRQAGDPMLIRVLKNEARNGIVLSNIGVEITESDAMRDVEATRRVCRALRRLGVKIAIDDFGTGYSSLSFLKRLPVDIVKIDRSFISGVLTDPHDETIAETIISISERFGFESLAEGAEQPEEIEWLRKRSCRFVQGYAICHPLPLEDFKSWLAARAKAGLG